MKLIDGYSGYIKMESIKDMSSATTGDVLRMYISRTQLRTRNLLNTIAADQGTEFDGEFLTLIRVLGITKLKGTA